MRYSEREYTGLSPDIVDFSCLYHCLLQCSCVYFNNCDGSRDCNRVTSVRIIDKHLLPVTALRLGGSHHRRTLRYYVTALKCAERQLGSSSRTSAFLPQAYIRIGVLRPFVALERETITRMYSCLDDRLQLCETDIPRDCHDARLTVEPRSLRIRTNSYMYIDVDGADGSVNGTNLDPFLVYCDVKSFPHVGVTGARSARRSVGEDVDDAYRISWF